MCQTAKDQKFHLERKKLSFTPSKHSERTLFPGVTILVYMYSCTFVGYLFVHENMWNATFEVQLLGAAMFENATELLNTKLYSLLAGVA